MDSETSKPRFASLAEALGHYEIELSSDKIAQLDKYCQLLWSWNEKMNLTRHDTYEKFVVRDITDSIALAECLEEGEEILDVGTGGGVPGIPLAILRPDIQVSLCESVGKKAQAVDDIVTQMGLPIPVYKERAEAVLEDFRFSTLVVRAVGPIGKLLKWFEPHWASIGRLLLIKGPKWVDERAEARHQGRFATLSLRKRCSYSSPGGEFESVILEVTPKASENDENAHEDDL